MAKYHQVSDKYACEYNCDLLLEQKKLHFEN